MVPVVTITGTSPVVAVTLTVLFSGVVLKVIVSEGSSTSSELVFFLGGIFPVGGMHFRFLY